MYVWIHWVWSLGRTQTNDPTEVVVVVAAEERVCELFDQISDISILNTPPPHTHTRMHARKQAHRTDLQPSNNRFIWSLWGPLTGDKAKVQLAHDRRVKSIEKKQILTRMTT